MPLTPTFGQFIERPHPSPLIKPLDLPGLTPQSAFEPLADRPFAFLLESAKGPAKTARYSFLGADPFMVIRSFGNRIETIRGHRSEISFGDPLEFCRNWMRRLAVPGRQDLPPFIGGAVGFFSYDLARLFEDLPRPAEDDLHSPDLTLLFIDTVVAFDHVEDTVRLIHCPSAEEFRETGNRKDLYDRGIRKLAWLADRLKASAPGGSAPPPSPALRAPRSNRTKEAYIEMIRTCKAYIGAGDIYQANLSHRMTVEGAADPWSLYLNLRDINPSPFSAFLKLDDFSLVSGSPERLVRVAGGIVETRPIAGTRPRGKSAAEDEAIRRALVSNEKEVAEHIMLVDLERNDLGKISTYGSVEVDELMITELYSHVIHIVSNIRGVLAPGKDCFDVIRAVFPGGTITGVPKVRCMEIITELERVCRGPYSGSIGYISFSGNMDLNIIIRTSVVTRGKTYIQAGGGIVADSDPEKEYEETLHKAEALLKAMRGVR